MTLGATSRIIGISLPLDGRETSLLLLDGYAAMGRGRRGRDRPPAGTLGVRSWRSARCRTPRLGLHLFVGWHLTFRTARLTLCPDGWYMEVSGI
jgi:hypothetical protein